MTARQDLAGLNPGEPITVSWRKFDGSAHWTSVTPGVIFLGEDDYGWWYGQGPGVRYERPGAAYAIDGVQVGCFARDRDYTATFYQPVNGLRFRVYVDVTDPPRVVGHVFTAIDLDLDVIECFDGEVFIDDEDEFAEHQVRYGYPTDVVHRAEAEAERLVAEFRDGDPRFAESLAEHWREVFRRVAGPSSGAPLG